MTGTNQKIRTNIYTVESVWSAFKKICKREGINPSNKLTAFMQHYVQAHSNGNPQLKISVYAKPEEPQPVRVLCMFIDGALSDGRIHCRKAGMWVPGVRCYSCGKNSLRKQKK
jgi:hypothetical protein